MKILLVDDGGTIIDSTDVERDDLIAAQSNPVGAMTILADLNMHAGR